MLNEFLFHLFDCTWLNVLYVCSTIYGLIQKFFLSFYMYLEVILSLFVFMFSAYFVFHCLNMFYVEKQVSEFFVTYSWLMKIFMTHLATRQSRTACREFIQKLLRITRDLRKFSRLILQLSSRETPRNSFLKSFSWKTCFKPLSSSLKPLF